jgi:type II secretory ATPase GspE/PulE/Tfp pilus assembly ATPase PilB-like protein
MDEALSSVLQLQAAHAVRRRPLGALLVDRGLITTTQLEAALVEVERGQGRLGEMLVEAGCLSRRQLAATLAEQADLEFVDLSGREPDPAVTGLLTERFAHRVRALPLRLVDDSTLLVAVADPTDVMVSDDLRMSLGMNVALVVAERDQLDAAIKRAYRNTDGQAIEVLHAAAEGDVTEEFADDTTTTAPAIQLVNKLLGIALEEGASDVHFEPQRDEVVVRARIDGVMRQIGRVPKSLQLPVASRLKVMGELDIAEKRVPQDGRVTVRYGGTPTDMRMAVIPTTYGEQLVLRILQRRAGMGIDDLGMSPHDQTSFERAIKQPYGAVIACGPTGSGKTTTLYGALSVLNQPDRVLMTIEDPV